MADKALKAPIELGRGLWRQIQDLRSKGMHEYLVEAARHGDVVRLGFMPGTPAVLISDPDLLRQILVTDAARYSKSKLTKKVERFLGRGLITAEGEDHKAQRAVLQPLFHSGRIQGYGDEMVRLARDHFGSWQAGQTLDIQQELTGLTLHIVARTLFGLQEMAELERVMQAMEDFETAIRADQLSLPLPAWLPTKTNRLIQRNVDKMQLVVEHLIAARRQSGAPGADLLSTMLASDEAGRPVMPDQLVRDEMMTFIFAGHETTVSLLTWAIHLLMGHPAALAKLRAEVDAVAGVRPMTYADLAAMPYTEQVIKEVLRLMPAGWAFDRAPREDVVLGGYRVAAGEPIFIAPYVIQRDPRHFYAPLEFIPERWTTEMEKGLHPFAYFPFGGGPRICIGNHFAILEARLLLPTLLQMVDLAPAPDAPPVEVEVLATLKAKHGLWMRVGGRRAEA